MIDLDAYARDGFAILPDFATTAECEALKARAAELVRRGHRIGLMTDARSGGLRSAVFADREHFVLQGSGIAGRGVIRAARSILALAAGIAAVLILGAQP